MAIGTPTLLGNNAGVTTSSQTSYNTGSVTIPNNSLVVVVVGHSNGTTASGDPSAVSDGTNSFTKAASDTRGTDTNCSIWYRYYTTGATVTITATVPTSNMGWIYAYSIANASSTPLDVTDNATGSGGTQASTVTTSANVAQADSIAIWALYRSTSTAWSTGYPPTNYTSLVNTTNGTRTRGFAIAHHTPLTAGATESASCSLPASADWAAPLAVFKGAAGGAIDLISGSVSGVATVSASIVRDRALSPAAINGLATVSAGVVRTRAISPSVAGAATVTGNVVRTRALSPTVNSSASVTASVVASGAASTPKENQDILSFVVGWA